jgi:hypothetical protein
MNTCVHGGIGCIGLTLHRGHLQCIGPSKNCTQEEVEHHAHFFGQGDQVRVLPLLLISWITLEGGGVQARNPPLLSSSVSAHGAGDSGTSTEHDKSHESRGIVVVLVAQFSWGIRSLPLQRAGLLRRHSTASWTYLSRLIK